VTSCRPERKERPSATPCRAAPSPYAGRGWPAPVGPCAAPAGRPLRPRATLPLAGRPRRRIAASPPAVFPCARTPPKVRSPYHNNNGGNISRRRLGATPPSPSYKWRGCLTRVSVELTAVRHGRHHRGTPLLFPPPQSPRHSTPPLVPAGAGGAAPFLAPAKSTSKRTVQWQTPAGAAKPRRRQHRSPKLLSKSSPGTVQVALRPRLAGPGCQFAGIWPDRRRPQGTHCEEPSLPKGQSAHRGLFCKAFLQGIINSQGPRCKLASSIVNPFLLKLRNCIENRRKIRKMQTQICWTPGEIPTTLVKLVYAFS
jgi:hypothetical protein